MKAFETIDLSGDAGIRAYGNTLGELFMNAALGMYSLMADMDSVQETKTVSVAIESHSIEGLLVSWLNELIFHFDARGFMGKKIIIQEMGNKKMAATVTGEDFDPVRHEGRLLLKAATYHNLHIEKADDVWKTDVIFDI